MHIHRTLMHTVMASGIRGLSTPEAVNLGVVPMFHITGFVFDCLGMVAGGTTMVMLPRWDRELTGRLIARHQVSHWTCIPTMIIDLFASPHCASFDLRSLKFLPGGGAGMPQAVAQRGGTDAVQVPAGAGGLRDQQPRRLRRRDGQGRHRAARRGARHCAAR